MVKLSVKAQSRLSSSDLNRSRMPKNRAISIGINGYRYTSSLNYAKKDALLFASFFENEAKFDEAWLFSDDSPNIYGESTIPDRTSLLRFFRRQFEGPSMSIDDNLWLFFSGHGVQHEGKDYVLPIDGDPEDPEETAISLDMIVERLRRSKAGNIVLAVDSCRIGGRKGQAIEGISYDGITTIFSCKPNESSWEIGDSIEQGAFTHVLIQNLRQQINGSSLTIEQTERHLQKELSILNRKYGKQIQTPHIRCESASRASTFLLPAFLHLKDTSQREENFSKQASRTYSGKAENKSGLSLIRKEALRAEKSGRLNEAKSVWSQIAEEYPSQRNSYEKAMQRIGDRSKIESQKVRLNQESQSEADSSKTQVKNKNDRTSKKTDRNSIAKQVAEIQRSQSIQKSEFAVVKLDSTGGNIDQAWSSAYSFTEKVDDVAIEMIVIPSGTFSMGSSEERPSPNELPVHDVTVEGFLMSKYPITKGQWREIAKRSKVHRELKLRPCLRGSSLHPVVEISWDAAVEFCDRLTQASDRIYRLPTEAEWEYACRAETTSAFHFGDGISRNVAQLDASALAPVNQFHFPNAFGLHGMHGGVWEWCLDQWHSNYIGAPEDGTAWINSDNTNRDRIQRGGSWRNEPQLCRSACRMFDNPQSKANNIGLRVVCSP